MKHPCNDCKEICKDDYCDKYMDWFTKQWREIKKAFGVK